MYEGLRSILVKIKYSTQLSTLHLLALWTLSLTSMNSCSCLTPSRASAKFVTDWASFLCDSAYKNKDSWQCLIINALNISSLAHELPLPKQQPQWHVKIKLYICISRDKAKHCFHSPSVSCPSSAKVFGFSPRSIENMTIFGVIEDILLLKQYVYTPSVWALRVNLPFDSLSPL